MTAKAHHRVSAEDCRYGKEENPTGCCDTSSRGDRIQSTVEVDFHPRQETDGEVEDI